MHGAIRCTGAVWAKPAGLLNERSVGCTTSGDCAFDSSACPSSTKPLSRSPAASFAGGSSSDLDHFVSGSKSPTGHVCRYHRQTMSSLCPARCSVSLSISAPCYTPTSSSFGTFSLRASPSSGLFKHKPLFMQFVYPICATKPFVNLDEVAKLHLKQALASP